MGSDAGARGNVSGHTRHSRTSAFLPHLCSGLFLAGAWCDTGWPATMEGAVLSGETAANAIVEDAKPAHSLRPLEKVAP